MGVVEDVSEERRARASLRAALQREHEAVERLAALDRSKNDFIASVSHELRTPITSVIGYADLLMSREISDDQLILLEPVLRNARRLELLIEDLLTVSRMDNGTFVYRPGPMDLSDTVGAAVDTASLLLADRRLKVDVDLPEAPVRTVGDSAQIQRALANLISNAIKFTPDDGSIEIVVEPLGDKVEISVADTGVGIPDYEQSKIFDRFFRSPRANEEAVAGTGLGLYIVDQIVRAHSGSVSFKSVEGKGTTFMVTLPLRRP
jgi:signal transduction histidine kinase